MRSAFQIFFGALLGFTLLACGAKDEVVKSELTPVVRDKAPQFSGPPGSRGEANEKTLLQISCESTQTEIALPHSLQPLGTRNRERLLSDTNGRMAAPILLGVNNRVARILWQDQGGHRWVDYSLPALEEVSPRASLAPAYNPNGGVREKLGLAGNRVAAVSPEGEKFVLAQKDRLEFRSVAQPSVVESQIPVKGLLANPRWIVSDQGQEIFLDRISGSSQSQLVVKLNSDGALQKVIELPKAKLSFQLGLRRWNKDSYIWMEWSEKKQLMRVWSPGNRNPKDFEMPLDWKPGPGFVLGEKNLVVVQSNLGIFYGELIDGRVSFDRKLEYSPTVEDNIRRGIYDWKPGQIYSSANDKQMFVVLPSTFGRMLYAIDEGRFFRKLGEEPCENPDFYPVFE